MIYPTTVDVLWALGLGAPPSSRFSRLPCLGGRSVKSLHFEEPHSNYMASLVMDNPIRLLR